MAYPVFEDCSHVCFISQNVLKQAHFVIKYQTDGSKILKKFRVSYGLFRLLELPLRPPAPPPTTNYQLTS